jgi:flavin reductase
MSTEISVPEMVPIELSLSDSRPLRRVLGTYATGVTVLSIGGPSPRGMTANSFTSVSLDPPLVLTCVDRDAWMHDNLIAVGSFGISVLAADQEHVARHFANRWRPHGLSGFEPIAWKAGRDTGAPMIRGALAWFECRLWRSYDGGDHSIIVGRMLSACQSSDATRGDPRGLLFHRGQFRQLSEEMP